jgi:hypothetical protein
MTEHDALCRAPAFAGATVFDEHVLPERRVAGSFTLDHSTPAQRYARDDRPCFVDLIAEDIYEFRWTLS